VPTRDGYQEMAHMRDFDGRSEMQAKQTAPIDELTSEIGQLRARWNVLHHPFYQRWSAGELSRAELRAYAREYDHAVIAIAVASRRAAELSDGGLSGELERHAAEEEAHIELWRTFIDGAGGQPRAAGGAQAPLDRTRALARTWSGAEHRSLAEHLVTLYAVESAQPEIAQVKLDGLLESYGFEDGPATEYFRVHAVRDAEHAALARASLGEVVREDADVVALDRHAESVYRAYWELLDGLESIR
jgi:pyrroloquinoline-quinone synthase